MINSNSIAFDIDSVVADTMSLFFEIAEKEYNISGLSHEDITSYNLEECLDVELDILINIFDRIMRGDYVDYSLKPYVGAPEVIKRLSENGGQVLFITARSLAGPIHDWISKISSTPAGKIEVIATGSFEGKIDFLLEKNIKYFVEDRLETAILVNDAGIEPIIYCQPWNRSTHSFLEVSNWSELGRLIFEE